MNWELIQKKVKTYHDKYQIYYPVSFFILGFAFDLLTLGQIDDLSNIIGFPFYVLFSGFFLWGEYAAWDWEKLSNHPYIQKVFLFKDEIFHFLQGALLSAFTIFYFKSTSFTASFIFLLVFSALLVLNELEFFQKRGPLIKSTLFSTTLLSYVLGYFPMVIGQLGLWVFILSLLLSLVVNFSVIFFLIRRDGAPSKKLTKEAFAIPVLSIHALFLFLYLFKAIPPLPLSIKSIGIYHNVKKQYPKYILTHQKPWWKFWHKGDQDFFAKKGDKVFVFTKIYAPRGFKDKIYLKFLKKTKNGYRKSDRIPLTISGGRKGGFRGYAYKKNYDYVPYKVIVETEQGLEIGRVAFQIYKDDRKEVVSQEVID